MKVESTKNLFPYSEKAAARILECHPRTLKRYRVAGLIEFYELPGGRPRYSAQQLMEFVESRRRRVKGRG